VSTRSLDPDFDVEVALFAYGRCSVDLTPRFGHSRTLVDEDGHRVFPVFFLQPDSEIGRSLSTSVYHPPRPNATRETNHLSTRLFVHTQCQDDRTSRVEFAGFEEELDGGSRGPSGSPAR
jgi:hypothetical protein